METFHFALRPSGFLFLGNSESVDGAADLYATFDRENHIFQAKEISARPYPIPQLTPTVSSTKIDNLQQSYDKEVGSVQRISFGDLHQKLLEQYAPPSVIINEEYEVVHMSEKAGKYFQFQGG